MSESETVQEYALGAVGLRVLRRTQGEKLYFDLTLTAEAPARLHWGLQRRQGGSWHRPPHEAWPAGTEIFDDEAVQTPFATGHGGTQNLSLTLPTGLDRVALLAVLYFPDQRKWVKPGKDDFRFELPVPRREGASPEALLDAACAADETSCRQSFTLDSGERLAADVLAEPAGWRVRMAVDSRGPLLLQWGMAARFRHEWTLPPPEWRPAGTAEFDAVAVRTPFSPRAGAQFLEFFLPRLADAKPPRGLNFVLHEAGEGTYLKADGNDLHLSLWSEEADAPFSSARLRELADEIVSAEAGKSSWTLMHRYHLAHDLLPKAEDDPEALALVYVWLRYSAVRQLDWQRRYNTRPRLLSDAQARLTGRLAGLWRRRAEVRPWSRRLLTTCGRGGDGQKVRDEILNIMHRHRIKEAHGTFMEEWHQKLHNNTTPDDVAICQGYLQFLQTCGDLAAFYHTVEDGGVSRQRLRGFDRPIVTDPLYYPDKREGLIHDFENFLQILKSVHSGADLETATGASRRLLPADLNARLGELIALRRHDTAAVEPGRPAPAKLLNPAAAGEAFLTARRQVGELLARKRPDGETLELLFLDLALEEGFRAEMEKLSPRRLEAEPLTQLVGLALENLRLTEDGPTLERLARHWRKLRETKSSGRDWSLHALSVLDRLSLTVRDRLDATYGILQPKADYLGRECGVDDWARTQFAEEALRSGPEFALAGLLKALERLLRAAAGLGGWQLVGPGAAGGVLRAVDRLAEVQEEHFTERTVLLCRVVEGAEEIPVGVTAVLAPEAPDLVSHLAVRARNEKVVLAGCPDEDEFARLSALAGRHVALHSTPAGGLEWHEATAEEIDDNAPPPTVRLDVRRRNFSRWAVRPDEFTSELVGAKAGNLARLRGKLPEWIRLPAALALPFGVCEQTLAAAENCGVAETLAELLPRAEQAPGRTLPAVRSAFARLIAPAELRAALTQAWTGAGLPELDWEKSWRAIGRVWASKWNERAFLSRRAHAVPHDHLQMSVLIQGVVPADYAFVIHTVDPRTGDQGRLFAELVLGLGETLVGNYPGRALGFSCAKSGGELELISYPSKSVGLYGRGVIFRSDSNGEDLAAYAGAGLYDSFLAEEPEVRPLDYTAEPLLWDPARRDRLLRRVAELGQTLESACGAPQDLEGAIVGEEFHLVQARPQVGLD